MIVSKVFKEGEGFVPNVLKELRPYVERATLNADGQTYTLKLRLEDWHEITRYQFEAELMERGLHETVMGMLHKLAQAEPLVALWIDRGNTVSRFSKKTQAIGCKFDIDLDEFFKSASQKSL